MPKPTTTRKRPGSGRAGGVRTAAALLRGLLSLAALLTLLAGLPLLLWWATTIVGPPGLTALSSLFTTDDSGQVFLLALAVAGWAGWALFTCAVLLEIPAQLRGRAAPRIRGLVGQRAAAALVGTVLLALPAGTALAAPATTAPATASPVIVSAAVTPGSEAGTGMHTRDGAADEAGTAAVTYTVRDVRPAESLWSIAETVLGDGQRWEDIAALNEGRTMGDGSVFHTEQPIQPGWVLRLPADAKPPQSGGLQQQEHTAASGGITEYSVEEGDSLSSIADTQLGDSTAYTHIFELNKGKPQPDGRPFTDPDLIYPGQHLTLPHQGGVNKSPAPAPTPAPTESKPRTGAAEKPAGTASPPPASPTPSASTAAKPTATPSLTTPTPATSASATAAPAATGSPAQSVPVPAARPAPKAEEDGSHLNFALVAGIGTLLAASLAGALGIRRILQQRQRRAGQTISQDTDPTHLEQILAAASEPAGIELLDRVLRTLAHHASETERELPALRGARLEPDGITLLLDEPAEPIAPFTDGPDTRTWSLDGEAVLLPADQANDVQAPYPGLITLGATETGLLLADLMTCKVLLLDGEADEALEVARALALELGTCAWTDDSEILTTGLGARLAGLLPQGRIRTMPHLPAVAADLGELLLEAHQSGQQVLPWLLIGAGETDEEHLTQLADALAAARNLHTAIVLPATDTTRRVFPHAEILDTRRDQDARVEMLDEPVALQRITDEQYLQYVHALQMSLQEPEPGTGAWEFAEDHDQAAAAGAPLTVRVTSEDAQDPGNPFPALLAASAPATPAATETEAAETAEAADAESQPAAAGAVNQHPHPGQPREATPSAPTSASQGDEAIVVCIEMLGPLHITGGLTSAHSPRTTAIAALIHLRPGRSAEYLCQAMDPVNPWSTRTLHSRLSELRNHIGLTDDGYPLLPRPKNGSGYAFHPAVTSDWDRFQQLASRGLAAGPEGGIADLETAMRLVRGKPFDGRNLPWADPVIQDILSRITDTAHTLARWHTDGTAPDLDAARRTIQQALDIDETSEVLYRDLLHIERAADNQASIRRTVARVQQMARTYDITLDSLTENAINHALTSPYPHHSRDQYNLKDSRTELGVDSAKAEPTDARLTRLRHASLTAPTEHPHRNGGDPAPRPGGSRSGGGFPQAHR
ncbi:LysM peptidoglycan-binding domain-containing protein [Streptomyces sp. NPDC001903]|uniref:LysM peptidoglycan-binding domain-containing protein n=1 Tax=Streptomyces sp. NPDC001903 TaxID=3364622 RepID=UPI00368CD0EC